MKIANKSDEAHYVVKSTVRNGDTLVELAPAQKSLTYLNEIVYTTTQGRKLTKSWFAKYKLPDGDLNHGYNHILYRHSPNSSATLLNPSKAKSIGRFSSDSDIKPLIESALTDKLSTAQIRNIEKGGIEVIVDFERQIGFQYNNPKTNNIIPLDRLLIVLDDTGSIITAYPIKK